jgi:hypothetical protein
VPTTAIMTRATDILAEFAVDAVAVGQCGGKALRDVGYLVAFGLKSATPSFFAAAISVCSSPQTHGGAGAGAQAPSPWNGRNRPR